MILAAVLCLFFASALRHDAVLSGSGILFDSPAFAGMRPSPTASNPLLFDQVYQFIPWHRFMYDSLRQGAWPLWNPYSLSGTPIVATMQAAVFYPINLALLLIPFTRTFVVSAILRLWIAGFATYLLARRSQLSPAASLVSAMAFTLSGFLVVWLGHPQTNVAIWLPGLVLLAECLVEHDRKPTRGPVIAALALLIGIQFTGGHIETSVDILFATGVYSVIRGAQILRRHGLSSRSRLMGATLSATAAGVLGIGLAAVQLVPFLEWLRLSAEYHRRAAIGFQFLDATFRKNILTLPLVLFPDLYGNPAWETHYVPHFPWTNYTECALYIGTLPLALAVLALLVSWRANQFVRVWGVLGALALGMALRLPVFDWVNQLPGLSLANPGRLRLVVSFSLCMLAGFGADVLFHRRTGIRQGVERSWVIICASIGLVSLILLIGRGAPFPLIPKDYHAVDAATYAPLLMAVLGVALLLPLRRSPPWPKLTRSLLIVLVLGELFYYGQGYNSTVTAAEFYPKPVAIAAIQEQNQAGGIFRVTALRKVLVPDAQVMFHEYDVRGLDFPTQRYLTYLDAIPDRLPWIPYGVILASADSPLIRVLNLKYIISDTPTELENKSYIDHVESAGSVFVGEVNPVQPRSFMVYDVVEVPDDRSAQQLLRSRPDLVRDTVLIPRSQDPPRLAVPRSAAAPVSHVSLVSYRANSSEWRVSSELAGYLFTSDSYYPGWTVYLDGRRAPLYRSDIAFRSVYVPAGDHVVEYRFQPESVRIGALLSVASLASILVLLVPSFWFTRGLARVGGRRERRA